MPVRGEEPRGGGPRGSAMSGPARHRESIRQEKAEQERLRKQIADLEAEFPEETATVLPKRPAKETKAALAAAYKGRRRLKLLTDIAMNEFTYEELARMYGVTTRAIEDFEYEFGDEITEIRQALRGELEIQAAGLWISKKQNRLAELQAGVEAIDEMIDGDPLITTRRYSVLMRLKTTLLRAAADEMEGRKSAKAEEADNGTITKYVLEMDDDVREALT